MSQLSHVDILVRVINYVDPVNGPKTTWHACWVNPNVTLNGQPYANYKYPVGLSFTRRQQFQQLMITYLGDHAHLNDVFIQRRDHIIPILLGDDLLRGALHVLDRSRR